MSRVRIERKVEQKRLKVALMGDEGVGKTSLMYRVLGHEFSVKYPEKKDVMTGTVCFKADTVKLMLHEIEANSDKLVSQTDLKCTMVYLQFTQVQSVKSCDVICIVLDLSEKEDKLKKTLLWTDCAQKNCSPKTVFIVLGNKFDIKVAEAEARARAFAEGNCYPYYPVSAKSQYNLHQCMEYAYEEFYGIRLPDVNYPRFGDQFVNKHIRLRMSGHRPIELMEEHKNEPSEDEISYSSDPHSRFSREESSIFEIQQSLESAVVGRRKQLVSTHDVGVNISLRKKPVPRHKSASNVDHILSLDVSYHPEQAEELLDLFKPNVMPTKEMLLSRITNGLEKIDYKLVKTDSTKDTILHLAVRWNHPYLEDIIYCLDDILKDKAFFEEKNASGNTALHIAVVRNNAAAVKLLLNVAPAKIVRARNDNRQSIFHLAALHGRTEIMQLIIDVAKDKKIPELPFALRDKTRSSCYQIAALRKHKEILDLLPPDKGYRRKNMFNMSTRSLMKEPKRSDTIANQFCAIMKGKQLSTLEDFLGKHPAIIHSRFTWFKGGGLLHYLLACHNSNVNKVEVLRLLIEKGVDCNLRDDDGNIPLHFAVAQPYPELVRILLEAGSDVGECNSDKNTVYHIAMYAGYHFVIQTLLEHETFDHRILEQVNMNRLSCFHIACNGQFDSVRLLLKHNESLIDQITDEGENGLHIAARHNNVNIARVLLSLRSSLLFQRDKWGRTPLLSATNFLALETATLFMKFNRNSPKKLDLSDKSETGYTAFQSLVSVSTLDESRQELYFQLLDEFLEQGVDIDTATEHMEMSPLNLAAIGNNTAIGVFLLNRNASVSTCNYFKDTPLHFAAEHHNEKLVQKLLAYKADSNALNMSQHTPMMLCALKGGQAQALPVAERLLQANAKTMGLDNLENKNVLHHAIEWECSPEFVRLLLKYTRHDVEHLVNGNTIHGDTPLSIAITKNLLDVAMVLVQQSSVPPKSRLLTPCKYIRVPHRSLYLDPEEVYEHEILIPSDDGQHGLRTIFIKYNPHNNEFPLFPEQYHVDQQAYIYTILGSSPYIWEFVGRRVQSPSTLVFQSHKIKCSLNDFILAQHTNQVNIANAIHLAEEITAGFMYIHQYLPSKPSVIHNWINRFSIFLTEDNHVKITSFQYAVTTGRKVFTALPFSPYTAPEVVAKGNCSEKSDVYSFGILLWEILTNRIAWTDSPVTEIETMAGAPLHKRPPLNIIRNHWLKEENVIHSLQRCWSPKKHQRPTFQELHSLFSNLKEKLAAETHQTTHKIPLSSKMGSNSKGTVFKTLNIEGSINLEYPKEFLPVRGLTEKKVNEKEFQGGAGAVFEFSEIDNSPCLLKTFPLANFFLEKVFVILSELEMLKKFRQCGPICHYVYHQIYQNRFIIYMNRYNTCLKQEMKVRNISEPPRYFSPDECWSYAIQIAYAIRDIHEIDQEDPIVHRDIKAANVFIGFKSNHLFACLGDFGIACHTSKIKPEQFVGTRGKVAPEVEAGTPYGTPTDIYAFGLVLYEMISFSEGIPKEPLPPRISTWEWKSLTNLARMCTQRKPELRPTASAVVAHLKNTKFMKKEKRSQSVCHPQQIGERLRGNTFHVPENFNSGTDS